jgi:hypothetical protein
MIPLFRFGLIANGFARDGEGYRTPRAKLREAL